MSSLTKTPAQESAKIYPSYGQPQVDRDYRALYDRGAALEQFQSGEFAQLQQELRYQKAQVTQAAQTNRITACRRWTKSIACVLNGLFSTAFFPAAGPACALSVPCTDP
ncbi:hypothetical protein PC129_g20328 [Phytophthora cactorum]|uniref:Uncharacterized protein n=1 Tax=Phytophthora cactorum TaxID=29920 RepID=A0A8T1BAW5_9STRA|nr:hypothetical protein Pcac1_g14036 [Phytophthora cactorum]KAG2800614.1 hypothetical protein PC113_g24688 [Phytophthora cactorum]KAG2807083.1 hypothetical protein PC111_g17094 [Phytophthora cactorum]KAG2811762.1 hypothetical protein PC112_g15457 [Phytophthora cactorum]KAG2869643.1 hypothetical protein PC114_g27760 [Phytophthora cactorum]